MAQGGPHSPERAVQQGPPYRPEFQSLGETPTILPDVPVNVLFLILFCIAFVGHAWIFRRNQAAGKKFLLSVMVFVFCFTRIIATILRTAWACNPDDIHLAIAATICVYAGTVFVLLPNLFLAQRIVRAQHPRFGWSKSFSIPLPILIIVTIASVLCLVAAVIVKFYTLEPESINTATGLQRFGAVWLAIVSLLPLLLVGVSSLVRGNPHIRRTKTMDKFGEGSMRAKVVIVLVSGILLSLGASFRAATTLMPPVPVMRSDDPLEPAPQPWYLSKACFYIFNFTLDACVCFMWLILRIDKRFYVPDGASGAFSYAGGFVFAGETGNEKKRVSTVPNTQDTPASVFSRDSRISSRISVISQRSRAEKLERLENRVSWGGVSHEAVQHAAAEDGKQPTPYPAVIDGYEADDVAVDGVQKEMGWDPKSGKWALRPIESVRKAASMPASQPACLPPGLASCSPADYAAESSVPT